jgi:hypothetical protein
MPALQKMASFDAQMRLLVPRKVSEDDKLIEYDALLLDRFLDILQDLHGAEVKETVSFPLLPRPKSIPRVHGKSMPKCEHSWTVNLAVASCLLLMFLPLCRS